jgi:hypothetical protein
MQGSYRSAVGALERWQPYADQHGALIVAPQFSREHYPAGRNYNRGNICNDSGDINNFDDWTFTTIEEIFDEVVSLAPGAPAQYSLQRHSAGGQFEYRMALLASNYRIETAARVGRLVTLAFSSFDTDGLYFSSRETDLPPVLELYQ